MGCLSEIFDAAGVLVRHGLMSSMVRRFRWFEGRDKAELEVVAEVAVVFVLFELSPRM